MKKKISFFIIVDDGGFPYVDPCKKDIPINFAFYENVLKLAKKLDIKIPICFTLKYLDIHHISQYSEPLEYATDLIAFIKENKTHIEFGYHGLTHFYKETPIEFFDIYRNEKIPYNTQSLHIKKSFQIIQDLELPNPVIFVPPGHAWESGVTDRLLAQYGVKFIVSVPSLQFMGRIYSMGYSKYLIYLPRAGMGILHSDIDIDSGIIKKTKLGTIIVGSKWIEKFIKYRRLFYTLLFRKGFLRVHSYMTHIGNFSDKSMNFWCEVFDYIRRDKQFHFCRSNKQAIEVWRK